MAPEPLRCDLLVFDLDGTLIDSERDLANSVNATLAFLGRPHLDTKNIADFIGDGAAMLVRRALEATGGFDDPLLTRALPFFLDFYRTHNLDYTRTYPGVLSELKRIREAAPALPMAVLTNKPVKPSRVICDGLGLSGFFFQNYGGDSFPTKKPHPQGMATLVQEASQRLSRMVNPSFTVLIGDSHVDIQTARNAGVRSIGCLYGLSAHTLRELAPDAVVNHPGEWLTTLQRLLQPT